MYFFPCNLLLWTELWFKCAKLKELKKKKAESGIGLWERVRILLNQYLVIIVCPIMYSTCGGLSFSSWLQVWLEIIKLAEWLDPKDGCSKRRFKNILDKLCSKSV